RETEDVVDEQQHVLFLHVAEVFGHGQAGQGNTQTGAWWLVHLAEYQGGIFKNVGFVHFDPQVVTFTGTFTNTGEYRSTTEVACHTGNHFLDQNGFTNTGTTEYTNLSTLNVRRQQVDDLNTGFQHFRGTFKVSEMWCLAVDRPAFLDVKFGALDVEGIA